MPVRWRIPAMLAVAAIISATVCGCAAGEDRGTPTAGESTVVVEPTDTTSTGSIDPTDPPEETRRSGVSAQFGGPPYGLQPIEEIEDGRWCATLALFWGGEPPQNVTFTFTGITAQPAVLSAEPAVCGQQGATDSCIGFVMTPEVASAFCSMILVAGAEFASPTETELVGTLECTEAIFCDQAIAREAEPGPPIVVANPSP